jgi:hypothetical protein
MRAYLLIETTILGIAAVLSEVLPNLVTAQITRQPAARQAEVNPPGGPQPAIADPAPAGPDEIAQAPIPGRAARRGNQILRGSELIGLQVWGAGNQRLGTVRDFVVDYQGDCPALLAAVAPDIEGVPEGYVFVPFDVAQLRYDNRLGRDYLALTLGIDQFRNAPRIARDNWNLIRDPQFLERTRQFYRRTERSAARPVMPSDRGVEGGFERAPATERERGRMPPQPEGGRSNGGRR